MSCHWRLFFWKNLRARKKVSMIPKKVMIENTIRKLKVNPIVQPFRKGAAFLLQIYEYRKTT